MMMEKAERTEAGQTGHVARSDDGPSPIIPQPDIPETGPAKRRLESRRKLMEAARRLFVERGYHATRPQDISREAGVGHGTFYLHFDDKLDCFLAFGNEAASELDVIIAAHLVSVQTLDDAVLEMLRGIFEYSRKNPGVLAAALTDISVLSTGEEVDRVVPADRWSLGWGKFLAGMQAQGHVAPDVDTKLAGYLIVGAIRQGGAYASLNALDHDSTIEAMAKLFVRALK